MPVELDEPKIEKKKQPKTDNRIKAVDFVKILKKEHEKDKISNATFTTFQNLVSRMDTETNFRKTWTTTFWKR